MARSQRNLATFIGKDYPCTPDNVLNLICVGIEAVRSIVDKDFLRKFEESLDLEPSYFFNLACTNSKQCLGSQIFNDHPMKFLNSTPKSPHLYLLFLSNHNENRYIIILSTIDNVYLGACPPLKGSSTRTKEDLTNFLKDLQRGFLNSAFLCGHGPKDKLNLAHLIIYAVNFQRPAYT